MRHVLTKLAALGLLVISTSGCITLALGAAVAAGAGTAVYVKGQLKDTLDGTVAEVHHAARGALDEIGITVETDLVDDFTGKLVGAYADGTDVWIDVERGTASTTLITIRTGYMGDQRKSNDILERTKRRLYGL